jgi:hypothetical protein
MTGGYGQLVTYLYNQVTAKGGKVELSKPVTAISYATKTGVTVGALLGLEAQWRPWLAGPHQFVARWVLTLPACFA